MSRNYGGLIWTNHALDRLEARRLPQETAWLAFRYPDRIIKGKQPGTMEYQKKYLGSFLTMIVKQNEHKELVVISCWIDPPLPGTMDEKRQKQWREYKKASWFGKWWLVIKRAFGF